MSSQETFTFNNQTKVLKSHTQTLQTKHVSVTHPKWKFPQILWIYKSQNPQVLQNFNAFRQLNILNTIHFAKQSNYEIKQISQNNYHEHLSDISSQKIKSVITMLEKRLADQNYQGSHKEIQQQKQSLIKRLIIYFVLNENGGVFVDDMVTIVENFDTWIQNIMNVQDINLGNKNDLNFKPQCFGFYHKDYSSVRMKVDVQREFQFEKKLVAFPSLEDDLIACDKNTQFMTKLTEAYLEILFADRQSMRWSKMNKNQTLIGRTSQWQIYKYGHLLALHAILQQRQHILNIQHQKNYKQLAIDSFGFVTINAYLALYKLKNYMGIKRQLYAFLGKLQIKYLPYLVGQLRFAHKLDHNIMGYFSQHLASDLDPPDYFMEKSFFYTYLLRFWSEGKVYKDFRYVTPIVQESLKANITNREIVQVKKPQIELQIIEQQNNWNNPQWNAIQKNVWVIWDKGLKGNSNLIVQLCYQNLKKSALKSGYKMNFVNDKNVHQYISHQTLQKINYALTHADYPVSKQAETDLWRLALVYEHGGVYVDATTFTTGQNFDFIQNITRVPSALVWNRYGNEPKNMMFWHGHYGHPSNWQLDYEHKTKKQWHLSYENNFIAAVKGSELIGQWLNQFMLWMVTDYATIEKQMIETDMWRSRWIREDHRYLLAMDAIKYVIAKKQKQLKDTNNTQYQSASEYYKIWGMTGSMNGQQKLRGQSNFENQDYRLFWADRSCNNLYRHQFSVEHAERVLGPLSDQTKFFGFDSKFVNNFLQHFAISHNYEITEQTLKEVIHPKSLLSKLFRADMNHSIYLMNYYGKMREAKTKYLASNKLGFSI